MANWTGSGVVPYDSGKPLRARIDHDGTNTTGYVSQDGGQTWTKVDETKQVGRLDYALLCVTANSDGTEFDNYVEKSLGASPTSAAIFDAERVTPGVFAPSGIATGTFPAHLTMEAVADLMSAGSAAYFVGFTRFESVNLDASASATFAGTRIRPAALAATAAGALALEAELAKNASIPLNASATFAAAGGFKKDAAIALGGNFDTRVTGSGDTRTTSAGDTRVVPVAAQSTISFQADREPFAGNIYTKRAGYWLDVVPWVNDGGVWKVADKVYVKQDDRWYRAY
jgi:hypothetical protein